MKRFRAFRHRRFILLLVVIFNPLIATRVRGESYDVAVYGASSAGVIAAVQAGRMGKSVVLISSANHVGGMTASGLGTTDAGNAATIGGLAFEFYSRIYQHYHSNAAGFSTEAGTTAALSSGPSATPGVQFTFEPHVAEAVFLEMLRSAGVNVVLGESLDRIGGVSHFGQRITSIRMKSGREFAAPMFIDATYEGDLLAAAQVPYRVGREGAAEFGESLAGVYRDEQLTGEVDPFWTPGDPNSGALPGVSPIEPGPNGTGDRRVQQYNFRLCFTDVLANRIPFREPVAYHRSDYELLRRRLLSNPQFTINQVLKILPLPGGKADINGTGSFSTDMAGDESSRWPEASDEERAAILQRYRDYTEGLFWFLLNDPGVPLPVRMGLARWGLAADEFTDNGNWPWQLYVREARRMIGAYVITQHDCEGETVVPDPIALGSYEMVSHKVTLFVDAAGRLNTEGFTDRGVSPYGISYRAIIPDARDCENLLVPICVSATHVAFNSIRMEPVYMMLGHAAGTAAALAIDNGTSVQAVDYRALARRLREDGQILSWPVSRAVPADAARDNPEPDSEPTPVRPGFIGSAR